MLCGCSMTTFLLLNESWNISSFEFRFLNLIISDLRLKLNAPNALCFLVRRAKWACWANDLTCCQWDVCQWHSKASTLSTFTCRIQVKAGNLEFSCTAINWYWKNNFYMQLSACVLPFPTEIDSQNPSVYKGRKKALTFTLKAYFLLTYAGNYVVIVYWASRAQQYCQFQKDFIFSSFCRKVHNPLLSHSTFIFWDLTRLHACFLKTQKCYENPNCLYGWETVIFLQKAGCVNRVSVSLLT